jgi:hypothetical protein
MAASTSCHCQHPQAIHRSQKKADGIEIEGVLGQVGPTQCPAFGCGQCGAEGRSFQPVWLVDCALYWV